MIAANLMSEQPVTVNVDDDLATAISLLRDATFRHLPVVNETGDLVGIVSDRDLRGVGAPEDDGLDRAWARAPVSAVMNSSVLCVDLEDSIETIAELIIENKIGAVPVIDGDGTLVGIVSYVDVLRYYARRPQAASGGKASRVPGCPG